MRYLAGGLLVLSGFWFLAGQAAYQAQAPDTLLQKAKTVLAQTEGKLTLPGLKEPVEILRDKWGVAHIYAKNADDLFFAQGYVAAQDRLFQIDLWRRVGVGETAEVFGKETLEGDRFARLIKFRGDMEAEWASYSPDTKEIATAFTKGINAYIDQIGDKLPIEFQILGYRPKHWQPADVVGRMSGIIMTGNIEREIFRAQLINAVGVMKARQIAPTDPVTDFAPVPGLDLEGIGPEIWAGYRAATKTMPFQASKTQSNNWAVTGSRTASGKPLLVSDPHRTIAVPSLRYLVHLNAPGWNVIGSGEPGLPGVALGHNEHIAWGFTIVGTDMADLFVEELNPKNRDEYKVGDSWEKVKIILDKVNVKDGVKPDVLELRYTRHGPIIHEDKKRNRAYVLKWAGSEPGTAAYLGSLAVGRAKNWKEFLQAAKSWKLPNLNLMYADVDGNIGWIAAALTPKRKGYDGLLPVPGHKYGWDGFLEVKDLPQEFNPARGFIATANHNILPPDYKHPIGFDWAPGFRFAVIQKRLEEQKKFTLEDMKNIQHENTSLPGQTLVRLAKQVKMNDPKLEEYADLFRQWDGVLSLDAQAGPLHAAWFQELRKDFYRPHLPKKLHGQAGMLSVKVMLNALEKPEVKWFGKKPVEGRDALLRETFAAAVKIVQKRLGDDPKQWAWGKLHTVTFRHALAGLGPAYAKAFNVGPAGRPGDAFTPNNTRHNEKFEQVHGASYRHLFDLADWDKGLATSTPGQSGQPGSPHYDDLFPLWAKGEYFPLAYSRPKVEEVTQQRLLLTPAQK